MYVGDPHPIGNQAQSKCDNNELSLVFIQV